MKKENCKLCGHFFSDHYIVYKPYTNRSIIRIMCWAFKEGKLSDSGLCECNAGFNEVNN